MRKGLAAREEERATFHGTFERFGIKSGWQGRQEKTLLLKDIYDHTGKRVCDHLWFNVTRAFAAMNLQAGDQVQFDARVKKYQKGYFGRRDDVYKPAEVDYKLSHPTKIRKIVEVSMQRGLAE